MGWRPGKSLRPFQYVWIDWFPFHAFNGRINKDPVSVPAPKRQAFSDQSREHITSNHNLAHTIRHLQKHASSYKQTYSFPTQLLKLSWRLPHSNNEKCWFNFVLCLQIKLKSKNIKHRSHEHAMMQNDYTILQTNLQKLHARHIHKNCNLGFPNIWIAYCRYVMLVAYLYYALQAIWMDRGLRNFVLYVHKICLSYRFFFFVWGGFWYMHCSLFELKNIFYLFWLILSWGDVLWIIKRLQNTNIQICRAATHYIEVPATPNQPHYHYILVLCKTAKLIENSIGRVSFCRDVDAV